MPGAGAAGWVVAVRERVGVLGLDGEEGLDRGLDCGKARGGETLRRNGLGDNRGREEMGILREFWQVYVLRKGGDLSCVAFGDYVVEMVLESFFVGGELGHALGEVDSEGGEAVGFEVDFLVVGDLPDCAGKGGRVS